MVGVGAAPAAEDRQVRAALAQGADFLAEFGPISFVECRRFVEFSVAAAGGVNAQTADAADPGASLSSSAAKCAGCAQLIM